MSGDEIWDEERWEAFLRENDRRLDRFTSLLFAFMSRYPPPDRDDEASTAAWERALKSFLRSRGLAPPEGGDPEHPGAAEEDWLDDFQALPSPDPDAPEADDVLDDVERVGVYREALALATDVLDWSNALPGAIKDSTLVQLCAYLTQIPAHVAGGHALGYERDTLGGNIACVKRGLAAANLALDLLREASSARYMDGDTYARLYERTFELRNALGIYVQELRRRFDLGVD